MCRCNHSTNADTVRTGSTTPRGSELFTTPAFPRPLLFSGRSAPSSFSERFSKLDTIRRYKSTVVSSSPIFKASAASSSHAVRPAHHFCTCNPTVNSVLSNHKENVPSSTYSTLLSPSAGASPTPSPGGPSTATPAATSCGPTKFTSKPAAMYCCGVDKSTALAMRSLTSSFSTSSGLSTTPPTSFGAKLSFSSSASIMWNSRGS